MRRKLAAALGLAALLALARLLARRRGRRGDGSPSPAEELRRRLDATRRDEAPSSAPGDAPAPGAGAGAAEAGIDQERDRVHERGRAAVEEMRRAGGEP